MESFKCRFCFKSFVNGRALGGHMRSHITEKPSQLSDATESDVSSSSSENPTMNDDDDSRFVAFTSSVILEDGEIETDSSRNVINLTRKRSKRTRKLDSFGNKKMKTSQLESEEPLHSSASDTTTEEDLAFCLMMLSRDQWKKNEEIEEEDRSKMNRSTMKGRYKCETCGKMFKSYQALGGHRASHKKNKVNNKTEQRREEETEFDNVVVVVHKRIHECPICFRVFSSGQALGGHKRSHGIGNLSTNHHHYHQQRHPVHQMERMIDLNLPAPTEEDEVSVVFQ